MRKNFLYFIVLRKFPSLTVGGANVLKQSRLSLEKNVVLQPVVNLFNIILLCCGSTVTIQRTQ